MPIMTGFYCNYFRLSSFVIAEHTSDSPIGRKDVSSLILLPNANMSLPSVKSSVMSLVLSAY
jgi:hypothetical protein